MAEDEKPEKQISAEALAAEHKLTSVTAPVLYASSFRMQGNGNDFNLIFQRGVPAQTADGGIHPEVGRLETVAVVTLSPQSLKDLSLLLAPQVAAYEKEFGEIQTPYIKRLAAKKA